MTVKSIILVMVYLQTYPANGQKICERPMSVEWHTQPEQHIVKWTLMNNICSNFYTECWNINTNNERNMLEQKALNVPQICPLQLQLGDSLFISSEETFELHRINLGYVSLEEFIRCPTKGFLQEQLIFGSRLRGMHQVDLQWLKAGTHYFAEIQTKGPLLCNLGLRLNVTVKQQFCQQSSNAPFCSRHGRCLSNIWEEAYNCRCSQQYLGRFCQEFDACSSKPCRNNAACIDTREGLIGDSYKCVCHSQFAGKNCSEIIGQCQPHVCLNGNCSNVTPNTFLCKCNKDFTGPFCEEPVEHCISQPCLNGGICQNNEHGYVCECLAGYFGHDCEADVNECSSRPCQNGATCIDMSNDVTCICLPMFTGKFCDNVLRPCELSPCLNNATCVDQQHSYYCCCMPGFTGKNCEEVIDYCRLLSINCLNEGLCLNIIGGFSCLCTPGWTGEFCQFVKNACLIYPDNCYNGATCIDVTHSKEQPHFQCLCLRGFTGTFCEMEINECDSNPCKHGGTCIDSIGHFKCTCLMGFEGEKCELDIDACSFYNIKCISGKLCVDRPHELNSTCLLPCIENTELCANGGSCFLDEDNQNPLCVCAPGWTGQTCLENINDCEENWCQHGATCEDGINKYRCICPLGYNGSFCELDIDYCIVNQCSDHGFCQDNLHNYSCQCMLGYEGPFCEVEINECSSSPCKNGATCMDLIGHFSCQCVRGFKGKF
ncbi:protein eyes shut homolog [Pelodiscus sinensis]|uniref:protein eyes shut homolog n=1 Tax=Pelodiscus sinensis TaxID=13735 RepID=UPI003F6BBF5C